MSAASDLYEKHAAERLANESFTRDMLNGLREHVDRIHYVMSTVRELAPESVLDIACNTGIFGAMMRWTHGAAPKTVVGIDISPSCCEFVTRVMGYDRAVCVDVNQWAPEEIDRADLVLCMEVLEHLEAPEVLVGKALAAAKKWVLFSVPQEEGDVDGEFHLRKILLEDLNGWVQSHGGKVVWNEFVASEFCEADHWNGWIFVLASPKEGGAK